MYVQHKLFRSIYYHMEVTTMALSIKDNYLTAMDHKKPDFVPVFGVDCAGVGFCVGIGPSFEKGPVGGGYDGFGVRWVNPASGGGTPIPAPGEFILDSETIVDWKKLVKFPDVENFDWEGFSRAELENVDRNEMVVDFGSGNGPYERLASLMGFEEALVAMYTEPGACLDLMNAIVDYKIQVIEKVAKYYHPEFWTNYDDVATERDLFMSPDMYRSLIKPPTKRYFDAVRAYGMRPIQHTCGYAETIVEDMIDTGAEAWTIVQPTNDINGIIEKYGDRFTIIGGYDSNGEPGAVNASDEVIEQEVIRDIDTYSKKGSYIFFGFRLLNTTDTAEYAAECGRVLAPAIRYRDKIAGRG